MNGAPPRPEPRTILVDLRVAQYNGDRGIPAYCQSIVRQLAADHPGHRYLFLWDERLPPPAWAPEFEQHGPWVLEEDVDRGQQGRIDVLFTACFFLPLHGRGGEYLLPRWLEPHQPHRLGIVYDLIPYLFPDRYLADDAARLPYLESLRAMRRYDRLFAISQATRRDAIRLAGVSPERILCVYGDIDHRKRACMVGGPPDPAVPARHGLRPPYAIYIGGEDWRKNMDGMVRGFAQFHARHPDRQLAVVCKLAMERISGLQGLAVELGLPPGAIVFTGYVSDEELVAITRQAEMMVFPSLYEGLGLPVLEAHGCGVPVVGSASSSVRELVIPELGCDPYAPASIAAAMDRAVREPGLRAASLAHGRRILASLGWRSAAAQVMGQLARPARAAATGTVAVVGALPPARTAIAPYTMSFLQGPQWRTDFFDANDGPAFTVERDLLPGNRLLPVEVLPTALARGHHDTVVFVLGNSRHHLKVLEAALATRLGCRQRRLAYLHEANLGLLLRALLGASSEELATVPVPPSAAAWIRRALEAVPDIGRSLRFLAEVADLDGLLVNSQACRDLIHAALGAAADRWTIDIAVLPVVADPAPPPARRPVDPHVLRVGTFGTAGDAKQLELVAKSVAVLARRRRVRLTVAGWSALRHCRRTGIRSFPFVEVHDDPTDSRLDELMRSVDVAVQLRTPTCGESSGAVARLLGFGRQVVVTGEGSFAELPGELTTCVAADCTPAMLAAAIETAAARRPEPAAVRRALEPFSPAASARLLAAAFGCQGGQPVVAAPVRIPA
ncbi:MAG: glycosyltransferase family 4 protein [Planctomycetia bacterium]